MKNKELIWIAIAVLLLLLIFNSLGIVLGFLKDILILAVLVFLIIFLAKQIKKKR
jgi:hypothetical protein